MIVVPELSTVVILTPRCGSGSLRNALLSTYPKAMMIYRHMEADGVPLGYDRWRRLGVVRDPVDRLWSLFKYLQTFGDGKTYDPATGAWPERYIAEQRASIDGLDFSEWICGNQTVFTNPYYEAGGFRPTFTVRHCLPETRKSQFLYLRPDLGTQVWQYRALSELASFLHVRLDDSCHRTDPAPPPELSEEARYHVLQHFGWDLDVTEA